jgi:hypothetical protein
VLFVVTTVCARRCSSPSCWRSLRSGSANRQRAASGPLGERPIALGHHRYEWLYVTAFVAPTSSETVWYLSNGIGKPFFAELLNAFACQTGAGRDRIIVLILDNAGWHGPENLPVPDGIRLIYQPAYSPELQPAEHLWPLLDEPLVNKHFDTIDHLDAAIADRCRRPHHDQTTIAARWYLTILGSELINARQS